MTQKQINDLAEAIQDKLEFGGVGQSARCTETWKTIAEAEIRKAQRRIRRTHAKEN